MSANDSHRVRPHAGSGLPCFHADPSGSLHCTLPEKHKGEHYHCYSKTEWPSSGRPTPSALRENA